MTTWIAHHGMTAGEYDATFAQHVDNGFRLVGVSGYGCDGHACFAAIFAKRRGPAWAARHEMTTDAYEQELVERFERGYRLLDVRGYVVDGHERFAAIFDKSTGPEWVALHGMTAEEYHREFQRRAIEGYRPRTVSGYAGEGGARFAAIFDRVGGPAWAARHDMTSDGYQRELHARVRDGYRLRQLSGYAVDGEARYAAIFEQSRGPSWVSYHALTAQAYEQRFDKLVAGGYRLESLDGYVAGGETLYASIWRRDEADAKQLAAARAAAAAGRSRTRAAGRGRGSEQLSARRAS
jgi:hypothetical protein